MIKNDMRPIKIPADILLEILNEEYDRAAVRLLKLYEHYMTKIATNSVLDETTGIYIYYLDEDLLEEMRISLFKSIYAFRKSLIQKLNAYQD